MFKKCLWLILLCAVCSAAEFDLGIGPDEWTLRIARQQQVYSEYHEWLPYGQKPDWVKIGKPVKISDGGFSGWPRMAGQMLKAVTEDVGSAFPTGWTWQQSITLDHTKVPTQDQTNFPTLINQNMISGATGNLWANSQSAGQDIRFSTDSAGAVPLAYENVLASYSNSGHTCQLWVKIPLLSHSSDTTIYIWYGNSGASAPLAPDPYGLQAVWKNCTAGGVDYAAVYHCEDAAGATLADSTSNAHNGTNNGVTSTTGAIFNGAYVNEGPGWGPSIDPGAFFDNLSVFSIECWLANGNNDAYNRAIIVKESGASWQGWAFWTVGGVPTGCLSGGVGAYVYTGSTVGIGTSLGIHMLTWTSASYAYTDQHIYVDGTDYTSQNGHSATVTTTSNSVDPMIMSYQPLAGNFGAMYCPLDIMDELRFIPATLTPSWIATEYNNQYSSSTFVKTVGTPQAPPSPSSNNNSTFIMLLKGH
jgi:hypothetical protein